jgi:predicted metal-binding protein
MIVKIDPDILLYDKRLPGLCMKPFYGHPKGCPNYGKKKGCPPGLGKIENALDLKKPLYVVYTVFNVGEFAEEKRKSHPGWTERQIYNPRYWQPRARKFQRVEDKKAISMLGLEKIIASPEAYGINITNLMSELGIELSWKWPPEHSKYRKNRVYIVRLAGYANQAKPL